MFLEDMINNVRIELGDKTMAVWTANDEITRAIVKTVALMSRLTPKRDLAEGTLTTVMIKDKYLLDISTILSDYIRIERVEYPVTTTTSPPPVVTFDVVGKYLKFREDHTLTVDDVVRIIYLGAWTPPTPTADGNYPAHLDDIVIIGAAGQALIFKAEEYTYKVITSLDSAITAIGAISAISFPSAPDISSYLTDAETALDAAAARFAAAVSTLGSMTTPLGDAGTALDEVDTQITAGEGYLDSGDDLINAATRGEDAGKIFGEYASHRVDMADSYTKEAAQRIALALAHEADSARESAIGNGYVNEAIQRISMASRVLDSFESEARVADAEVGYYRGQVDKAAQYVNIAGQYLEASGRYLANGQSKINEFLTALGIKPEFPTQKASAEQRA